MNPETRRIDHLVDLAADLRTGALSSGDYVAMLEGRFDEHEAKVEAFVPDLARLDRFHDRLTELQETYPSASNRPPDRAQDQSHRRLRHDPHLRPLKPGLQTLGVHD